MIEIPGKYCTAKVYTDNVEESGPRAPRKRYPLNHPLGHEHPYAIAANRIHTLELSNK